MNLKNFIKISIILSSFLSPLYATTSQLISEEDDGSPVNFNLYNWVSLYSSALSKQNSTPMASKRKKDTDDQLKSVLTTENIFALPQSSKNELQIKLTINFKTKVDTKDYNGGLRLVTMENCEDLCEKIVRKIAINHGFDESACETAEQNYSSYYEFLAQNKNSKSLLDNAAERLQSSYDALTKYYQEEEEKFIVYLRNTQSDVSFCLYMPCHKKTKLNFTTASTLGNTMNQKDPATECIKLSVAFDFYTVDKPVENTMPSTSKKFIETLSSCWEEDLSVALPVEPLRKKPKKHHTLYS